MFQISDCKYEYATLKETADKDLRELKSEIVSHEKLLNQQKILLEEEKLANRRLNDSYLALSAELSKLQTDSLDGAKSLRYDISN
jgi:hypothetical protein